MCALRLFGLGQAEEVPVASVVHDNAKSIDRRVDMRLSIGRPAVLRTDRVYEIRVDDLTRRGCRITADVDLAVDSVVTLGFAGVGQSRAQIVRREELGGAFVYGCYFEQLLPSGAVTASTRNNIGQLAAEGEMIGPFSPAEFKMAARHRALLIVGISSALWATLAGVAFFFLLS